MKLFFLFSLLLACSVNGQVVKLRFVDTCQAPIGFVSVFDSSNHIYQAADSTGLLQLASKNYTLVTSHVSYKTRLLNLLPVSTDSLVVVSLERKDTILQDITIIARTARYGKVNQAGTYNEKSGSHTILHNNLKIGFVAPQLPRNELGKLTGISFKLDNLPDFTSADFLVEIKLYRIHEGRIVPEPLNTEPLYIHSGTLRKKNTIHINEYIPLVPEGFLISFEIPRVVTNTPVKISFPGSFHANYCQAFVRNNQHDGWPPTS